MLKPKVLPTLLEQALSNGVFASALLNHEGSLIACAGGDSESARLYAAIASSLWHSFASAGDVKRKDKDSDEKAVEEGGEEGEGADDAVAGDEGEEHEDNGKGKVKGSELTCLLTQNEKGYMCVVGIGSFMVALLGDDTATPGALKAKTLKFADFMRPQLLNVIM